jgi:hypothetical protein
MKTNKKFMQVDQRITPRNVLSLCLAPLLAAAVWGGCKEREKGVAEVNPTGTYTLVSVDGKQAPCTIGHEGVSVTIKSGAFMIGPDGTCTSKMVFSVPSRGDASREVKASYTQKGATLTMKWEGAGTTTGTVQGDAFTMHNEGMLLAYRK